MKTSPVFTRRHMGLDNNVWLSMLLLIVTSCGLLAYKIATKEEEKPYIPISIIINGSALSKDKIYNIDENLFFKAGGSIQADDITWDFGDNTPTVHGYTASHAFHSAATFPVTVMVNNNKNYLNVANITIVKPVQALLDSTGNVIENISGKDVTQVGVNETFSTSLPASSYTWSVMNNTSYAAVNGKTASFNFKSKGNYTILLVLNNNRTTSYRKSIIVLPNKSSSEQEVIALPQAPLAMRPVISFITPLNGGPGDNITINGSFFSGANSVSLGGVAAKIISVTNNQIIAEIVDGGSGAVTVSTANGSTSFSSPAFTYIPPKPATAPVNTPVSNLPDVNKKRTIAISSPQLKKMLQLVVDNRMHVQDFDQYFCLGGNTLVYVNKSTKAVKFEEFCNSITGKKIEIESSTMNYDPNDAKCITDITVKYKTKGGLLKKIF